MLFDKKLVERVATLTKADIDKLPHIHIPNESIMFQLMVWRNKNKDAVRDFLPLVSEGIISAMNEDTFQYFNVQGNDVFHMHVVDENEYVAFAYHRDDWKITPIANTISFYPKEHTYQDMITVHATVMAYLEHIGKRTFHEGETYYINEVATI